ncbi:J domain-containing protein [Cyanobium sp. AMD-g]|uniref:J domain-containing protein n=1 Tax=Cyanobium sp. AMD-g TaxID=2823699 RepID=UPI0020CF8238|nr:J domain-containing protein [Cyanobium sp. AMD-g]MCP9932247.1 J domain-containing protein [Cyanobium sp. AMD-g]
MARTPADHYATLGVPPGATTAEIKAAYRTLVKQHHPDAGGDQRTILALNAAWEVLRDGDRRRHYDHGAGLGVGVPPHPAGPGNGAAQGRRRGAGAASDEELLGWLQQVYVPIDRLIGQVINPFPAQLRSLAADPYDDDLMEAFCAFLEQSRSRMEKVEALYRSRACPAAARGFGLSLYHCLSQVQDALVELERYTMGYVDSYLHDGKEMLREARLRRSRLKEERRRVEL